jgi:predicted DNA-binding protein with PD1-like motif
MKFSEARQGRVFVVRLEQGEVIHEVLERFAADQGIRAAAVMMVGGANKGSQFIVGPKDGEAKPVIPIEHALKEVHEVAAVGTLFPDESGKPSLHVHMAAGREGKGLTGCIRKGVVVWLILEVIIFELVGTAAVRERDVNGFEILNPRPER